MGNEEDENLFLNLSKKELQCMCKKNGLSPYRNKPDLVKSLVSFLQLQKNSLSPLSSSERFRGGDALPPASLMPQLQSGSQLNCMVDGREDGYSHKFISDQIEEVNEGNLLQSVRCNNLGSCTGGETYVKDSGNDISEGLGLSCTMYGHREISPIQYATQCDGNNFNYEMEPPKQMCNQNKMSFAREGGSMTQIQSGNPNFSGCPTDHALANPMTSSMKDRSSSFEFYVRSEEGIKLYVDLNSNPSNWNASFKKEVGISQNVQNNKSQSLHQDLGRVGDNNNHSLLWNTDSGHELNGGLIQSRCSPSLTVIENGHPDGGNLSLRSSAVRVRRCNIAVDMMGNIEEDQVILFSPGPSFDVLGQITSATESCPRDEGTLSFDLDVSDTPNIKSACNSALNLTSEGANKRQISKVDNGHSEKITYSLVNPDVAVPGCFTSGAVDMQLSEVESPCNDALHTSDNGGFLVMVDSMENEERYHVESANTSKLNHYTSSNNLPTSAEELARSNLMHRRESSGCSQFDNSIEKVSIRYDSDSSEGLQKKRQYSDGRVNNISDKPDAKILKVTKHHASEVLPRRSMRLVTK